MKKLAIIIGFLFPLMSFASNVDSDRTLATVQELCAKERDPVKRQNYCHILDRQSQSQTTLADFPKNTVIV
ncbi:hypothetical protein [Legionella jordanis]|uniref:Uncharacterized protein n=1 Tax=Legionella jordanis TaxID=456 RepID=A0A0W0VBR9_9GAMM|nr:hypothetical protein [Legionella jordanis]KTD17550.1 hypothetical protein Ljor_1856 [Legionella jordanis]RMX05114.1 hypothetical protein EAW55_00145 [Legionella jordanis]RMX17370.1 hypothetical protein EAS68_10775 [Legionella jordanis]VEH13519.1 Uncharacterised protein [Legionella jordanis]HAT8714435.1 hypothetical protein [Legionella jordanis]